MLVADAPWLVEPDVEDDEEDEEDEVELPELEAELELRLEPTSDLLPPPP